jgi:hypothetical protein
MSEVSRPAMLAALWLTVRGGLAGVRVHGRLPAGPVVWAVNHHSWCDPFIAGTLLTAAGHPMVPRPGVRHEHRDYLACAGARHGQHRVVVHPQITGKQHDRDVYQSPSYMMSPRGHSMPAGEGGER